eukprot:TRINITY_DN11158_c0_g1_i1.p1 TRINITY_DN11158_c0_g1~~TRINITY_DN11158_c0_g1_i1.p1  ORF type:complete len:1645 (-),score=343.21 TRINITY_DN11158_c0_g1_i1:112-4962(-)
MGGGLVEEQGQQRGSGQAPVWICATCTYENRDTAAARCEVCAALRNAEQASPSVGSDEWACPICTVRNHSAVVRCEACGQTRPGSLTPMGRVASSPASMQGATPSSGLTRDPTFQASLRQSPTASSAGLSTPASSAITPKAKDKKQKGALQISMEKGEFNKELAKMLGSKHGIPNTVFNLFETHRLLQRSDPSSNEERQQIIWALRECAPVYQDKQLELMFDWLVAVLTSSKELCTEWGLYCAKAAGNPLLTRDMEERPYVAVAWLAQDILKQWRLLPPGDRKFWEDVIPNVMKSKWRSVKLYEIQGILDRIRGRYIIIDRTMQNREIGVARFFLRRTPVDILRSTWENGGSFLHLYPTFVSYGDREAAEDVIDRLADAYLSDPSSDPAVALKSFMETAEATNRVRRDFLISFLSACRVKYKAGKRMQNQMSEQPTSPIAKTNSWFRPRLNSGSTQPEEQPEVVTDRPLMPNIGITYLEILIESFKVKSAAATMSAQDLNDLKEDFEMVLLINCGEALYQWAKKAKDSFGKVNLAKGLLEKVAPMHIAEILREASGQNYKFLDTEAAKIVMGGEPWTYDHRGGRYFSDPRSTTAGSFKTKTCSQLLYMYMKMDLALDGSTVWRFMRELERDSHCVAECFCKIAPRNSSLRKAIGKEVVRGNGIASRAVSVDDINKLLGYSGFFEPSLQDFLQNRAAVEGAGRKLQREDFFALLEAVVKLISLWGGAGGERPETVISEMGNLCRIHPLSCEFVRKVCDAVNSRPPFDFLPEDAEGGSTGFNLGDFHECARRLQVAREVIEYRVKGGRIEKGRAQNLIDSVKGVVDSLLQSPPVTWASYFGTLDTIVFFLEYMGKEDLVLAYEQMTQDISCAALDDASEKEQERQKQLVELLECVKKMYTQALVTIDVKHLADMQKMDIATYIMEHAQRLKELVSWCGVDFTPEDWDDILEIAGITAAAMQEKFSVLMLPHHTQMITLIMLGIRACGTGIPELPKTMLARVGTGEGKSWIIGMLAAFIARRGRRMQTGLRAHVVIDNNTLKSRDYDTVSRFFDKLDIKSSMREEHIRNPDYQVVYCTGVEIWNQCRGCQETGDIFEDSIKNAVLIVDEVDGLIIDGEANIQYMYPDDNMSAYADWWLRQLENGINPEAAPFDDDDISKEELNAVLEKVLDAYDKARDAQRGRDFEWRGGEMYMIDRTTGLLAVGWWDLWYEIRHWIDTQWAGSITYKSIKSILCKKYCFTSYPTIFGLTGSLGQHAEKQYVAAHYDAITFNVPCFLETCRKGDGSPQGKPSIRRINKSDIVQNGEEAQMKKVVDLAVKKCGEVPVLVIAKDQAQVEEVAHRIEGRLPGSKRGTGVEDGDSRVIRLLEKPGVPHRFVQLVDLATQPWEVGRNNGDKSWRVTVTTAEGGRGHDYRVSDPGVDERGGLLLILMWVSWSEREWIQFIGRTARQDHEGQVAVYLDRESDNVREVETEGVDLRDTEAVVEAILSAGDKKMVTKFDRVGSDISRGTMMHKLTARYWKQRKGIGGTSPKQENVWRKLCMEYLLDSVSEETIRLDFEKAYPPVHNDWMVIPGGVEDEGGVVVNLGDDFQEEPGNSLECLRGGRLAWFLDHIPNCRCG